MKSIFKLLGWIVGIVVVALIAAGLWVATLDPNDYKDWVAEKVRERTGREVALNGKLGLTIYPWLGVEVNDMTLSNAQGFGDTPFLHVDHFLLRAKFLPLLREQYEIDTIELHGAVLNLSKDKSGKSNWADLVKEKKEKKPLPLTSVVLGGVDVKDATITWTDHTTDTQYRISNLNAATGELTYGAPIDLKLGLDAVANKPAVNARVDMDGVIAYDLDAERYSVKPLRLTSTLRGKNIPGGETQVAFNSAIDINLDDETATVSDLKLSGLGTEVQGQVNAARIESPTPTVKATLDVNGSDLALLFKIAEIEPLASQIAQLGDRRFDTKLTLDADTSRGDVDLTGLEMHMLGASISGNVKGRNIHSETPAFKADLKAAGPDLPALMLVAGQFQGGKDSPMSRASRLLSGVKDKSFSAQALIDTDMKSGDLDVSGLSMKLAGATIQGQVKAQSVNTKTPSFKGNLDAAGPDLPVLIQAAGAFQSGEKSALATYGEQLASLPDRSFKVKTAFGGNLKTGSLDVPELSVDGLGMDLNGNLKAENMSESKGNISGKLALDISQAKPLLTALGQPDFADVTRSISLNAGISGTRADVSLKPMALAVVLAGESIPRSPVKIELNADTQLNLDDQKARLDNFNLKGLGLNVTGKVAATKIKDAPEFAGDLKVAEFNLRELMRQVKMKPPRTTDKDALKKVALQTEFSGSTKSLSLKNLDLSMDDTNLKGHFSVAGFDAPQIRFGLNIDELDADRYMLRDPAKQGKRKKKNAKVEEETGPVEIPVEMLRKLDVQGDLKIRKLVFSKARMNNVTVKLGGKDGKVKLDPIAAKLYKGTADADISMDATKKVPQATINAKLQGIEAEPLLKDVMGEAKVRGTGNFSAALVTAGSDTDEMKKNLNGQMSLRLDNAALKGYNLGKIMRQGKALKDTFTLNVSPHEETDFTEITGNPVAKNGIITLDDLSGKSPGIRLSGKGVLANLPRSTVDYKLTATLVGTAKGKGGKELGQLDGVPLDCTIKGPLDDPKRNCDATKLLAAMGVKLIKGVIGLPGKVIQNKDGTSPLDPAKEVLKDIFN